MLEEIALSISTFVFLLCTLFVNSMMPAGTSAPANPERALSEPAAAVMAEDADTFVLAGEWNSGGRIFELTESGKLIYNGQVMHYTVEGSTMTIRAEINGSERIYTAAIEPLGVRVMKLNGVTMYKISG